MLLPEEHDASLHAPNLLRQRALIHGRVWGRQEGRGGQSLLRQHRMLFKRLNLVDFALLRDAEAILSDTRGIAYVNLLERGGQVPS